MWDPYAEFETTTLPNGLTIYAAHWPERPWEAMGFMIHSGAENDYFGFEGTAHFVEHLVSENAGVPKNEMKEFFERRGGNVNLGRTGWPYTRFTFWVPGDAQTLSRGLSLFGDMLFNARLERFIERERQVITAEFHRSFVNKLAHDIVIRGRQALYGGYWLARSASPLGTPDSLAVINQERLQSFYDVHYTPANMSVVGVGGLPSRELAQLLSESPFAANKSGQRLSQPARIVGIEPPLENRYVLELSRYLSSGLSSNVGAYKSFAVIPTAQATVAVRMLREMLGEALMENVREGHAWTYHIEVGYTNLRHFYEFRIECEALEPRALEGIENVIEEGIGSMAYRDDLFERQRQCALAESLMMDPNGRGICNDALDDLGIHQRIITLVEYVRDLEAVRMDDVRSLLRWLKPERRWTLIVKP